MAQGREPTNVAVGGAHARCTLPSRPAGGHLNGGLAHQLQVPHLSELAQRLQPAQISALRLLPAILIGAHKARLG